jgi:peptidyl-prolyl cis-trans isomerase C
MTFKPARLLLALIAIAVFRNSYRIRPEPRRRQRQGHPVLARRRRWSSRSWPRARQTDSPQLRDAIKKDLIAREVMMQEAVKQGYDKNAGSQAGAGERPPDHRDQRPGPRLRHQAPGQRRRHQGRVRPLHQADRRQGIPRAPHPGGQRSRRQGHHRQDQGRRQVRRPGQAVEGHRHRQQRRRPRLGSPSSFPPEFAAGFTGLQKGQVTEPRSRPRSAYHVIKLDDVRPAKLPRWTRSNRRSPKP